MRCTWGEPVSALGVEWQRVACNMVVLAAEALPRGGTLQVVALSGKPGVEINAAGESINLTAELIANISRFAYIKKVAGIERGIANKFVSPSMPVIRTRFRYVLYVGAPVAPIL